MSAESHSDAQSTSCSSRRTDQIKKAPQNDVKAHEKRAKWVAGWEVRSADFSFMVHPSQGL